MDMVNDEPNEVKYKLEELKQKTSQRKSSNMNVPNEAYTKSLEENAELLYEHQLDSMEKLEELRKTIRLMNKDIPVIEEGIGDAIELDPTIQAHVEWFNDNEKSKIPPLSEHDLKESMELKRKSLEE